jgi:hypothetical protein
VQQLCYFQLIQIEDFYGTVAPLHFETMTLASGGSDNPHVDETTALLAEQRPSEDAVGEEDSSPQENDEPPEYYNRYQVIVLSICALVDPISFFCIVPFVPQMIYDLGGIEKSKVGFYAGLIVRYI